MRTAQSWSPGLASLLGLCFLGILNGGAVAQQTFTGCIGEKVGFVDSCPPGIDYHYDCNFARQHPSGTDEAAASDFCIHVKGFTRFGVQRLRSYGGDNCGYIVDQTTCQN
jgi:hypothetical protein